MSEEKIGEVIKFFVKPSVAAIKIISGKILLKDKLRFLGNTTNFELEVESIEIDNQKVDKAEIGDLIGLKVPQRVRPGDQVFKKVLEEIIF